MMKKEMLKNRNFWHAGKRSFPSVLIVAFLALLLIGAAGCPAQNATTASSTVGLTMAFVDNAPPASVTVNKDFPIYVDIINAGGANMDKAGAKFYLSGIGYNLEGISTPLANVNLLDKSSTFAERLNFAPNAKWTFELQNIFVLPLLLTSCYKYGTVASSTICVTASNESKICSIAGDKAVTNTAAPIQISKLTESVSGNKLTISFNIENKGTGQVYTPDADCDKLQQSDINEALKQKKVLIAVKTDPGFACKLESETPPYSPVNTLSGSTDIGAVECSKQITEGDHSAPLTVILQYKYRDSISKSISILPA